MDFKFALQNAMASRMSSSFIWPVNGCRLWRGRSRFHEDRGDDSGRMPQMRSQVEEKPPSRSKEIFLNSASLLFKPAKSVSFATVPGCEKIINCAFDFGVYDSFYDRIQPYMDELSAPIPTSIKRKRLCDQFPI